MTRAELFLSTDMVDPELRTHAWREVTRPFFETSFIDKDAPALEGSIRSRALGSLIIGRTSFNRQQYRRDRRIIVESELDQYLVQMFLAGGVSGDCDGVRFSAGPGDICAFDLSRPFSSQAEPGSTISIILSRHRIERASRGRSLHGAVLKSGAPLTRLLADLIISLDQIAPDIADGELHEIEDAAATLLCSCLAQGHAGPLGDAALAPALRQSMFNFIDANLADPELGPPLLLQRFRMSRAHLYRLFAADGGVARVIRERRLDAAYRALLAPDTTERTITQIAFAFGFSGSGQFQRAFTSRFNLSPSEARHEGSPPLLADQRLMALHRGFALYGQQITQERPE